MVPREAVAANDRLLGRAVRVAEGAAQRAPLDPDSRLLPRVFHRENPTAPANAVILTRQRDGRPHHHEIQAIASV